MDEAISALHEATERQRGYIITGQGSLLDRLESNLANISAGLAHLRLLTADNPRQQAAIAKLTEIIDGRVGILRRNLEVRRDQGFTAAQAAVATGNGDEEMHKINRVVNEIKSREKVLLARRTERALASIRWANGSLGLATMVALALLGTAYFLVRRDVRHASSPIKPCVRPRCARRPSWKPRSTP